MNVNRAISSRNVRRNLAIREANANAEYSEYLDAKYAAEKVNFASHHFGKVDDCLRCLNCEIGIWNGHKEHC